MKQAIGLFFILQGLLIIPPSTAQCDAFAKTILEIVRTESYEQFRQHFEPKEAKRSRMQWPEEEEATNYLNDLENALYKDLEIALKEYRAALQKQGWDLTKATYVGYERTAGKSSVIKINFKIHEYDASLLVPTYEGEDIYMTSVILDGKKGLAHQYQSYTLVDGERYTTFKPRADELAKGKGYLTRFLTQEFITDYTQKCTIGLSNLDGIAFLEYLVLYGDKSSYFHVNLETGRCMEVFK